MVGGLDYARTPGRTGSSLDGRRDSGDGRKGGCVHTTTGAFVCFEGGDGTGKSTQAHALATTLTDRGYRTLLTFEPGDTTVGKELRRIVLDPATGTLSDRTEVLLYAADKAEHVDTVVMPALERGEVVITDRYVDSMLAYQGAGRILDLTDVDLVARWATRDLRPHLTVVLDLDPAHGLGRFDGRDRIEGEPLDFFLRARQAFLSLAGADPDHYLVVDAERPADEIADVVRTRVEPLLAQAAR
jgi:dTMP kinase